MRFTRTKSSQELETSKVIDWAIALLILTFATGVAVVLGLHDNLLDLLRAAGALRS